MKSFYSLVLLCFFFFPAVSQDLNQSAELNSGATPLSLEERVGVMPASHRVLLIPYNPMLHLSDADKDIAEFSDKDPETLRKMFRMGLTRKVHSKIFEVYESHNLLTDYSQAAQKDLDIIYGSIDYGMDNVIVKKDSTTDSKLLKGIKAKKSNAPIPDEKYFNVKLSHPGLLKMLAEKYNTDIFVFLNQVEIKTHSEECLDMALQIYQREIKVHFSIFDKDGKQLAGNVAVALFPSNSNDIGEIMAANFPVIASSIAASLPTN